MQVDELMVRDVKTCTTADNVNRAAQLMWEHDCGFVVVVTPANRVAGMITDRDVCMAAYTQGLTLQSIDVADVMSTEVVSCAPKDDVLKVASRMRAHQVRRLPVVDWDGSLLGIVALGDLARRAAHDQGAISKGVSLEMVAGTLAEVCRPRGSDRGFSVSTRPAARCRESSARALQLSR